MVQKVLGTCEAKNGTETDELPQTGTDGHQRSWQDGVKNPDSGGRKSPSQRGKYLENRGEKGKNCEKGASEAGKQV